MKSLVIFLTTFLCFSAFAKEGGNGGGVFICGEKIELFDFAEARNNIVLWEANPNLSKEDYLTLAMSHIKKDIPQVADKVLDALSIVLQNIEEKRIGEFDIPFIDDVTITTIDPLCYQQVANWHERLGILIIDGKVFNKMDSLNQAGLLIHEAIYKVSRDSKISENNSDLIRAVVAKVFSDEVLDSQDAELIYSENAIALAEFKYCDPTLKSVKELIQTIGEVDKLCGSSGSNNSLCSPARTEKNKTTIQNGLELCYKFCRADAEKLAQCEEL